MNAWDLALLIAAASCGLTIFARAELMRPRVKGSYLTNPLVRFLMDATALSTVFVVFEIAGGARVQPGFAAFIVMGSVTSAVMLISMFVHDGRETVKAAEVQTRADDVADVKAALAEELPPALDAAMPQVIKDLAAAPDPWTPKTG